ncbi:MAG: hypothetical protein KIT18_08275 [Burkholderiales bacterium]|nr:hypothetical protein [Burkholderiales bacterium]
MAVFIYAWHDPLGWDPLLVETLMLVLLVEFFLIHATGFLGFLSLNRQGSPLQTFGILGGLVLLYFLIIWFISAMFDVWWPFIAFAWLLVGKAQLFFISEGGRSAALMHLGIFWAASVVSFLVGLFTGLIADLPEFGLTAEVAAGLGFGLESSDTMVDTPHKVIGAGAIYFGAMAFFKLLGVGLPGRKPSV